MQMKVTVKGLVALFVLGACTAWGRSVTLDLRSPVSPRAAARLMSASSDDFGTLRHVDLDVGAAEVGDVDVGDELEFTLFDDVRITLLLTDRSPSLLAGDVFLAEASGYGGVKNAVVLRTEDGLTVDVQDYLNERVYKVISTPNGVMVQEIEPVKGGRCGYDTRKSPDMPSVPVNAPRASGRKSNAASLLGASGEFAYVDILVAYDRNAAAWANWHGGIDNFAQTAVAKMNTVLGNTGLTSHFQFRLVGVTTVNVAASDIDEALDAAQGRWAGWEGIAEKREEVGADIVTTLIHTGVRYGVVGLGFALEHEPVADDYFPEFAYNVCEISAVNETYTMAHECGHNMGAGHATAVNSDYIDPGPQLYEYSAGFFFKGKNGVKYNTVMGYDLDGFGNFYTEAPFFSSPNYTYYGIPVGDAYHDNTLTLYNTFRGVSQFGDAFRVKDGVLARYKGRGGDVVIPAGVTNIGAYAFYECTGVTSVTLPTGLTGIGACAFYGCTDLRSVTISKSVTSIGDRAFAHCPKLETFVVSAKNPCYSVVNGLLCDKEGTTVFACPGALTTVTIPASVTYIVSEAFEGCTALARITFWGDAPAGYWAFYDVSSSCTVYVTRGSTGWNVAIPGTWNGMKIKYVPGTLEMTADPVHGGEGLKVTVRRVGGIDGRVAVKFKTQDSATVGGINGVSGRDFQYVKQYLEWEDGDASDRVVYVPTYVTDAAETVTLRLKLSVQTTGDYAGCETPELVSSGKVIASILPAAKGTLTFSAPDPMSVRAGEPLRVTVSRVGGSAGRVAVKLKTQDSATVGGIDGLSGRDFQYVKQYLEWEDGDDSDQEVEIPTVAAWWDGEPRTFRLKLSVQTTGDYAGCVTPALADGGKVIASIEPNDAFCPGVVKVTKVETVSCCSVRADEPLTAPPWWGYAGDTLRVTVSRVGGSFGRVVVKAKTQGYPGVSNLSAVLNEDLTYVKEYLEWNGRSGRGCPDRPRRRRDLPAHVPPEVHCADDR